MLGFLSLASCLTLVCGYAISAADHTASKRGGTLPTEDPFYSAPANLSDYSPGAIIRYRTPPNPLSFYNSNANLHSAWQLLYRTTGVNGEPLATVTTVMIPFNADYGKFLSYQVEIDAPYSGCFPSYTLQQGDAYIDNISAQYGELWYISALEKGWVVASPDHEGPNGAFAAGILQGHATLDGLRAVLGSNSITGVLPTAQVAIWGYSGGAQATAFALELQDSYAPELNIVAAAIGGTPANLTNALLKVDGTVAVGLVPSGAIGLSRAYPKIATALNDSLYPANASRFLQAENQCVVSTALEFAFDSMSSYLEGGLSFFSQPDVAAAINAATLGQYGVPKVPTYMYQGVSDELLPFSDVQDLYDKYCAAGATIQFVGETLGEHVTVALLGAAGAFSFLMDRLEGKYLAPGCTQKTVVSSILDSSNIEILGQFVYNDVTAMLGKTIGPGA
ncbi:hypothetical protein NQ176_g2819 [Zarea fungicola]|uniref:Uncharacterized protein n=1 Tax=Zarea fungicola TaxID=93591 RepID=A0ACC1NM39_9HYPO|nr:hypothetical protein NQ176_g2819 [Lecanicillium fungicola]